MKRQDARNATELSEPPPELDRDASKVIESVYERALCVELGLRNVRYRRQVPVAVGYKAIEALAPIHWVQVRSYLKATGCVLGLLINFNVPVLLRGVRRVILTG